MKNRFIEKTAEEGDHTVRNAIMTLGAAGAGVGGGILLHKRLGKVSPFEVSKFGKGMFEAGTASDRAINTATNDISTGRGMLAANLADANRFVKNTSGAVSDVRSGFANIKRSVMLERNNQLKNKSQVLRDSILSRRNSPDRYEHLRSRMQMRKDPEAFKDPNRFDRLWKND